MNFRKSFNSSDWFFYLNKIMFLSWKSLWGATKKLGPISPADLPFIGYNQTNKQSIFDIYILLNCKWLSYAILLKFYIFFCLKKFCSFLKFSKVFFFIFFISGEPYCFQDAPSDNCTAASASDVAPLVNKQCINERKKLKFT